MMDRERILSDLELISNSAMVLGREIDKLWKCSDPQILEILESYPSILGFDGHQIAKEIKECTSQIKTL